MNNPESLHNVLPELIRRGLPPVYAHRAAAELADHYRDLVDEMRLEGRNESAALAEASRRLGDLQTLVKKTVREYQRRHWCGRWRLVTFVLAPLPIFFVVWIVAGYVLQFASGQYVLWTGIETDGFRDPHRFAPLWMKFGCLISLFVVVPTAVAYAFAKLANRAALGWQWIVIVGCMVGLVAGSFYIKRFGIHPNMLAEAPAALRTAFSIDNPLLGAIIGRPSHVPRWFALNLLQTCQLLLPLAAAGGVFFRSRQIALRARSLLVDGS